MSTTTNTADDIQNAIIDNAVQGAQSRTIGDRTVTKFDPLKMIEVKNQIAASQYPIRLKLGFAPRG